MARARVSRAEEALAAVPATSGRLDAARAFLAASVRLERGAEPALQSITFGLVADARLALVEGEAGRGATSTPKAQYIRSRTRRQTATTPMKTRMVRTRLSPGLGCVFIGVLPIRAFVSKISHVGRHQEALGCADSSSADTIG